VQERRGERNRERGSRRPCLCSWQRKTLASASLQIGRAKTNLQSKERSKKQLESNI